MVKDAIIILNYNDYDNTYEYINKIYNYKNLDIIVVVDNCSTDDSYSKLLKLKSDKVHVIQTEKNRGYAYGNNYGVTYLEKEGIRPQYIIISNPDIVVDEKDINKLLYYLEKELPKNTFSVTGVVYDRDMNISKMAAWKKLNYVLILREATFFVDKLLKLLDIPGRQYSEDKFINKKISEVDVIPGCFFISKYELWKKIGGFDEETFLYFEEDILAFKARSEGYHLYVIGDTIIQHMEGTTVNKAISSFWKKGTIQYNSCMYYLSNYLKVGGIRKFFYKLVFRFSQIEKFLFNNIVRRNVSKNK